jgi:hypothetical protein
VTHGTHDRPREQQKERQPHQLDPPRDLDPRARRHLRERTAAVSLLPPAAWEWSFWEDGSLALDRHELWDEPGLRSGESLSQSREHFGRLNLVEPSGTVTRMPSRASARRARARRRAAQPSLRARRLAGLALLSAIALVTLLLTAFGSPAPARVATTVAGAESGLAPSTPLPQVVAQVGELRLDLPVAQQQLTALGYYGAGNGALALEPLGRQGNRGRLGRLVDTILGRDGDGLTWYRLQGGHGAATSALAVGAAPGADVFSPVDGTVVGITDYVVDGRERGVRVDIQPASAPSLVVSVSRLEADPALTVGSAVVAATHRLGRVVDLSDVEEMALAEHTQDAGNHVTLEVRPAATLSFN